MAEKVMRDCGGRAAVSMLNRREWLALTLATGASAMLDRTALLAQRRLLTRAIPSSGEQLPLVGLGSSATFSQVASAEDVTALREVFKTLVDQGAKVFDTAPSYGASEEVAARIVNELGLADKIFWATKVNAARQGGTADAAAARAQIDASFNRIKKAKIDLIQVHNMGDVRTQLPILKELKQQGRVRYIGVTTTFEPQYAGLIATMRNEPLDFVGVDYAIDNREVEATILPLARERRRALLRAIRAHAPVPARRRSAAARLGERVRCRNLGAVLPEVCRRSSGHHCRHPGNEPGEEHGRQHRRRHRHAARRSDAEAHGRVRRSAAFGVIAAVTSPAV